jgi:hypothetical protein
LADCCDHCSRSLPELEELGLPSQSITQMDVDEDVWGGSSAPQGTHRHGANRARALELVAAAQPSQLSPAEEEEPQQNELELAAIDTAAAAHIASYRSTQDAHAMEQQAARAQKKTDKALKKTVGKAPPAFSGDDEVPALTSPC